MENITKPQAGNRGRGRPPGVPNKNKLALVERLATEFPGYHPVVAMAAIANDPAADPDMRFAAHREVAQYVEPKRKAVEVTGAEGGPVALTFGWL